MLCKKNIIRLITQVALFVGVVLASSCSRGLFEPQEGISVSGYNPQEFKTIHSEIIKIAKKNHFSNELTFGNQDYKDTEMFQVVYKSVDDDSFISFKKNSKNDCLIIGVYASHGSEEAKKMSDLIRGSLNELLQTDINIQNGFSCS